MSNRRRYRRSLGTAEPRALIRGLYKKSAFGRRRRLPRAGSRSTAVILRPDCRKAAITRHSSPIHYGKRRLKMLTNKSRKTRFKRNCNAEQICRDRPWRHHRLGASRRYRPNRAAGSGRPCRYSGREHGEASRHSRHQGIAQTPYPPPESPSAPQRKGFSPPYAQDEHGSGRAGRSEELIDGRHGLRANQTQLLGGRSMRPPSFFVPSMARARALRSNFLRLDPAIGAVTTDPFRRGLSKSFLLLRPDGGFLRRASRRARRVLSPFG